MKHIGLVLMAGILVAGCSKLEARKDEQKKPVVCAVNYPLAYFAERIGGGGVTVVFPEMSGDPAFWTPSADDVLVFQQADLVLLNGADYAKWVAKVSLPQSTMLNTSAGLEDQFVSLDGAVSHTHGPGGAHAHGDVAFTLWLDCELAMQQAKAIYSKFNEQWNIGDEGFRALEGELKALDLALKAASEKIGDQPLIGSHPVYQYLARRYGLNMNSVHWEPDAVPDEAMWRELDDILEAHEATVMLWEDAPLPEVAEALEKKGIRSVVFNPCGNRPDSGDYLSVMQDNLKALDSI